DAGRRRRRQRVEEQAANRDGECHPGGRACRTASQDGRARVRQEGQELGAACPMARRVGGGTARSGRTATVPVSGTALLLIDVINDLAFSGSDVLVAQAEPM